MQKVLGIGDLHSKDVDYSSIQGYVHNLDNIYGQLKEIVHKEKITCIIWFGDVSDGGYKKISTVFSHFNHLNELKQAVNGEMYLNIGNHFFQNKTTNPEVYWCQPTSVMNSEYSPTQRYYAGNDPLFKVVESMRIGHVQFAFHHFSDRDKEYITDKDMMADYVVGIYHDEVCIPYYVLRDMGLEGISQNSFLSRIYRNVDMAWHGHIHIPQEPFRYENTDIIIPGACCPTQNSIKYKAHQVRLPILTIDNDVQSLSFATLTTGADQLTYLDRKEGTLQKATTKLREQAKRTKGTQRFNTYGEYLDKKGYPSMFKQLAELGLKDSLQVRQVCSIAQGQADYDGVSIDEVLKGSV